MKKLLLATLIMSSLGIVDCMEDRLKPPVLSDDATLDENYRNLPVQIAMHLEQAKKLLETGDATLEQLYPLIENHFILACALCEAINLPRPQLYAMICADFTIMCTATPESVCMAPKLALESMHVMARAKLKTLEALVDKVPYVLREKMNCNYMVMLSQSKMTILMDIIEKSCNSAYKEFYSDIDTILNFEPRCNELENYARERFYGWNSVLGDSVGDCINDQDNMEPICICIPAEAAIITANAHVIATEKGCRESEELQLFALPILVKVRIALAKEFANCVGLTKAVLLSLLAKAHYTTLDALSKKPESLRTELLKSIQPMMDEIQAILDAYKILNPLAG